MRVLNGFIALILLGFAAVHLGEADGLFWTVVYCVGAEWALVAALVPRLLAFRLVGALLAATVAAALLGVVHFWPDTPGWWHRSVWAESEAARDGVGMMILALSLLGPVINAIRAGETRQGEDLPA